MSTTRVGTGGIRGPDDRARVAGIAHLFENRHQLRTAREDVADRRRELPADRDESLRRDRVGHRLEHVLGDELDVDAGLHSRLRDVAVALESGRRRVELDDQLGAERQRLGDRLRPLQQEQPGLRPRASLRQFGHGPNAR